MLKVERIGSYYGKVQALRDVSFEVAERQIVSIIGANGAGKSTLMRSIMGIVRPKTGRILFEGRDVTGKRTDQIVKSGIVYIPEGRDIFPTLTVEDNLEIGAFSKIYRAQKLRERYEEMYALFPRLKERRWQLAGSLSGGEQQMLAIARGLMGEPKLLMFDEPSLGLAPIIVSEVFEIILRISREQGIPIVLVEQNAFMALSISQRCYVLENGVITQEGASAELIDSPYVKKAYLGA